MFSVTKKGAMTYLLPQREYHSFPGCKEGKLKGQEGRLRQRLCGYLEAKPIT